MSAKSCFAVWRGKGLIVEHAAGDVKFLLRAADRFEIFEAGHEPRDERSDLVVVLESAPFQRTAIAQCPQTDFGKYLDFALWTFVSLFASIAEADVIEHRFLRRALRFFVTRQSWQDERCLSKPMSVSCVERGTHIHFCSQATHCIRNESGIRAGAKKVAAKAKPEIHLASVSRLERRKRVMSCF